MDTPVTPPPTSETPQVTKSESHNPAFHFFLYLFSFLSLGFWVTGLGMLLYQLIDKYVPGEVLPSYYRASAQSGAKFAIAALIVSAPLYFFLRWAIARYISQGKLSETSRVRKWVTYMVLFIVGAVVLGDLVALVRNLLDGDASLRFILKVFVLLVLAGGIFTYHFIDMRRHDMAGKRYVSDFVFLIVSIVVIIATLAASFTIISNPFLTKDWKADKATITKISGIDSTIKNYYAEKRSLPSSLEDLKNERSSYVQDMSSVTYERKSSSNYQLCSTFKRDSKEYKDLEDAGYSYPYMVEPVSVYGENDWSHGKGKACFSRSVTMIPPQPYKPVPLQPTGNEAVPVYKESTPPASR